MIDQFLGYAGILAVVIGYSLTAYFNRPRILFLFNTIAATLLFIQGTMLGQPSIMVFHGFTGVLCVYLLIKNKKNYLCHREYCNRRLEKK